MDANVTQSWLMARAAGRQMLKQGGGGKVILMSSARGLLGHPAGYTAYCASKSAVDGITKALGCEWGDTGITVNALGPTVFRSPLTQWMFEDTERAKTVRKGFLTRVPKGRLGEPSDLAGPLCSWPRRRRTSIPATSCMPTAATPLAEHGQSAHTPLSARVAWHGIAQVFALAGHEVTIYDLVQQTLATAKDRILANLKDLDSPERGEPGNPASRAGCRAARCRLRGRGRAGRSAAETQKLFGEDSKRHVRPDTILASNTSVIPITAIMQGLQKRDRALGTHWWNPPFLVPLVEVIDMLDCSSRSRLHHAAARGRRQSNRRM